MTDEVPEVRPEDEPEIQTEPEAETEKKIDPILEGPPLSRREFLYYLWGSSMVVFLGVSGGLALWFALPRFKEGEFGGVFLLPVSDVPAPDTGPMEFAEGRFWLVNLGEGAIADPRQPSDYPVEPGIRAIYKVCTHLGCL
jgi:cytochrome b6-f complex iron-sulfur subunit